MKKVLLGIAFVMAFAVTASAKCFIENVPAIPIANYISGANYQVPAAGGVVMVDMEIVHDHSLYDGTSCTIAFDDGWVDSRISYAQYIFINRDYANNIDKLAVIFKPNTTGAAITDGWADLYFLDGSGFGILYDQPKQ